MTWYYDAHILKDIKEHDFSLLQAILISWEYDNSLEYFQNVISLLDVPATKVGRLFTWQSNVWIILNFFWLVNFEEKIIFSRKFQVKWIINHFLFREYSNWSIMNSFKIIIQTLYHLGNGGPSKISSHLCYQVLWIHPNEEIWNFLHYKVYFPDKHTFVQYCLDEGTGWM